MSGNRRLERASDPIEILEPVPESERLSADEAKYVQAARAANTLRGYRTDWSEFTRWCEDAGVTAFPATAQAISTYLAYLAKHGAKVGTMSRRLSAIRFAHQLRDLPDPTKSARVIASGKASAVPTAHRRTRQHRLCRPSCGKYSRRSHVRRRGSRRKRPLEPRPGRRARSRAAPPGLRRSVTAQRHRRHQRRSFGEAPSRLGGAPPSRRPTSAVTNMSSSSCCPPAHAPAARSKRYTHGWTPPRSPTARCSARCPKATASSTDVLASRH